MSARTSVTASASPRSRMPSASSGVRMRCTANTGTSGTDCFTIAAARTPSRCGAYIDPVEAPVGGVTRAAAEVLDDLADLVPFDRPGRLHVVGDARSRPHRQARPRGMVHAAVVRELQERERALRLDLLADPAQT